MGKLRTGYTTGACASAAAKAAASLLVSGSIPETVDIPMPKGGRASFVVAHAEMRNGAVIAAIVKDAGDDPDVTNGLEILAEVAPLEEGDIEYTAGEGVGIVTKEGLSVPPGEAAINPVPRKMIAAALREVYEGPVRVTVSIPGGDEIAKGTFNPRLGIMGGLSVLGTTGIVRPYSCPALRKSIECLLDVAVAAGVRKPVFTPGAIGAKAAIKNFGFEEKEIIEVSNEWGFMLDVAGRRGLDGLFVIGHPGKLAKLPMDEWDTHSKRSPSAVPFVRKAVEEALGKPADEATETVEGVFEALDPGGRRKAGDLLAGKVAEAVGERTGGVFPVAVALINMKHEIIGQSGDMEPWRRE